MKKLLKAILSLMMVFSIFTIFPSSVYAEASGDYEYEILDDGTATITNYTGSDEEITIPDIIDGYAVTQIKYRAFENCTSLTSVIIPQSITSIGSDAFYNCTNLLSIYISDSVKSIGDSAFQYCSSLKSISIPDGVTSINYDTFYKCTSLTSVSLPDSIISIEDSAFTYCTSLTSINIPDDVSFIGNDVFFGCSNLTNITLPDSVTSIGEYAFYGCNIESVTIPDGITVINYGTFYNCRNLTSVTLPDSLISIEEKAFLQCTSLTSITIPNNVQSIGDEAFKGSYSLKRCILPASITSIGDSAFGSCYEITVYVYPNSYSLEYVMNKSYLDYCIIGSLALDITEETLETNDTLILEAFNIDDNLKWKSSDESVVTVCSGDVVDVMKGSDNEIVAMFVNGIVTAVGPGTSTITVESEDGKTASCEVTVNATNGDYIYTVKDGNAEIVEYIGSDSVVSIPDTIDGYSVSSLGVCAFYGCVTVTDITIPNSVTKIGTNAFSYCENLEKIIIPDSVTSISNAVFTFCDNLTDVTMSNSVTTLYGALFAGCISLENFTIPESVTRIEDDVFNYCYSLKSITIPKNVEYIGQEAFGNCTSLTDIYFEGDAPEMEEYIDEFYKEFSTGGTFAGVTATAYYPADNSTWTDDVMLDYGGNITWIVDFDSKFSDVSSTMWYYNTVKEAYSVGLMSGVDDTHFDPDGEMSRGMVVTVLYRMAGAPDVSSSSKFSDVADGLWYSQAINWATSVGIVSGYEDGTFGPGDAVTREQMAVMLRNYCMKYLGYNTNSANDLTAFTDYKTVSSYAFSAIAWAVDNGIMSGTEDKCLNPTNTATRAECAKMLLLASKL